MTIFPYVSKTEQSVYSKLNMSGKNIFNIVNSNNMKTSVLIKIKKTRNNFYYEGSHIDSHEKFLDIVSKFLLTRKQYNDMILLKIQHNPKKIFDGLSDLARY